MKYKTGDLVKFKIDGEIIGEVIGEVIGYIDECEVAVDPSKYPEISKLTEIQNSKNPSLEGYKVLQVNDCFLEKIELIINPVDSYDI